MKPNPNPAGLLVLALAALTGAARLAAQQAAPLTDAPVPAAPAPSVRVLDSRTVPLPNGRNLIIQRVNRPPAVPAPAEPAAAPRPRPTPEQLAAWRALRPAPREQRILSLNVTRFGERLYYIEWWPHRSAVPSAVWSTADWDALRAAPDFDADPGGLRYLVFPYAIHSRAARSPLLPPAMPADGPGYLLAKGDPTDLQPIAALHKIWQEDGPALRAAAHERDRQHLAAAATPPQDIIIRYREARPIRRKGGAQ